MIVGSALLALPPHCHLHADTSTGQRSHARGGLATCLCRELAFVAAVTADAAISTGWSPSPERVRLVKWFSFMMICGASWIGANSASVALYRISAILS